ncbi:MAG: hypothetical protein WC693_03120 [Patescibacteria group bacterium]|jgi:hypothetical protein
MLQQKSGGISKSSQKIILIILASAIIIVIAWLLFGNSKDNDVNQQNTNLADADALLLNSGMDENTNTTRVVNNDPEAKNRDEERLTEVEDIRTKLAKFNTDKGNYPETLEELVTEGYYEELPVNPTPGGMDYVYTPIGSLPAKFYDLAYSLEAGTEELEPGEHIANPENIAFP